MNVHPTKTSPGKSSRLDELENLFLFGCLNLRQRLKGRKDLITAIKIATSKLSDNKRMAANLLRFQ